MAPAQKDIYIAKKIQADIEADSTELLQEYNMEWVFEPILELCTNHKDANTLICAIIYSYSPHSLRADLKMDGESINKDILKGLGVKAITGVYKEFVEMTNEKINESVGNLLDTYSSNWKFITARTNVNFHSKNIKIVEDDVKIAALDPDKQYKAKTELGKLRREAGLVRKVAEETIELLQRDFMITENRVKGDFGVSFIDTNLKPSDIWSWRSFITHDYLPRKNKSI